MRCDSSPDFRNTKGNGFQSPDLGKKLMPMNNGSAGTERVNRALLSPPGRGQKALRMDSCSHFEEGSLGGAAAQMTQTINRVNKSPQNGAVVSNKMRKMNNARREWEQRHCSNSPFRIDNYGSSSSLGMDSMDGSPMAVNRGYGLRANIKGAAAADASQQQPLNLTNKQSSFFKKNQSSNLSKNLSGAGSPMTGGKASTMRSSGSNESHSPVSC